MPSKKAEFTDKRGDGFISTTSISVRKMLHEEDKNIPMWKSCRINLAIACMLNMAILYLVRVNMSVALICMTPSSASNITSINMTSASASADGTMYEFSWNKVLQGNILSAFYYGYFFTQIPGGWLATRFGGKHVMGGGMIAGIVCTMVSPMAARYSPYALMVVRFLMGVGMVSVAYITCVLHMGAFFPSVHNLWGRWAPPLERSKLVVFSQSGIMLGTVIAMSASGFLCNSEFDNGWPLIFYVYGIIGLLCYLFFIYTCYNTPNDHPRITTAERDYINSSIGSKHFHEDAITPWMEFIKSKPLIAILVAHTCNNWGNYTLVSCIPMFIRDVFNVDIKSNGLYSAIPFILMFIIAISGSQLADFFRLNKILSTVHTRKIFQTVGFVIPAIMVIVMGYISSDQIMLAVACLTVGVGFTGLSRTGYACNHVDIAPRYAGILIGITNTLATVPGMIAPSFAGWMTQNKLPSEWRNVFFVCGGIYSLGAIVYMCLAEGCEQAWSRGIVTGEKTNTAEQKVFEIDLESEKIKL